LDAIWYWSKKLCWNEICSNGIENVLDSIISTIPNLPGDKIEEGFNRREKLVIHPDAIFVKLEE
jgi:hypothetical protein